MEAAYLACLTAGNIRKPVCVISGEVDCPAGMVLQVSNDVLILLFHQGKVASIQIHSKQHESKPTAATLLLF